MIKEQTVAPCTVETPNAPAPPIPLSPRYALWRLQLGCLNDSVQIRTDHKLNFSTTLLLSVLRTKMSEYISH